MIGNQHMYKRNTADPSILINWRLSSTCLLSLCWWWFLGCAVCLVQLLSLEWLLPCSSSTNVLIPRLALVLMSLLPPAFSRLLFCLTHLVRISCVGLISIAWSLPFSKVSVQPRRRWPNLFSYLLIFRDTVIKPVSTTTSWIYPNMAIRRAKVPPKSNEQIPLWRNTWH